MAIVVENPLSADSRRRLTDGIQTQIKALVHAGWVAPKGGEQLGDYTLINELGVGRFAVVWKAHGPEGQEVAIKIFCPQRFVEQARAAAAHRFYIGAKSLAHLNAARVPKVIDNLHGPAINGTRLWFAMDHAADGSLEAALRLGQLSTADKLPLVDDLLLAIGGAHEAQRTHRDLKPSNVFLVEVATPGAPRLLGAVVTDFDVAQHEPFLTRREIAALILGENTRYIAPELLNPDREADLGRLQREPAVDLYALCVVVFDMFAGLGVPLPPGRSVPEFDALLKTGEGWEQLPDHTKRELPRFLARGLSLDSRQRFRSCAELDKAWTAVREPFDHSKIQFSIAALGILSVILLLVDWVISPASWLTQTVGVHAALIVGAIGGASAVAKWAWSHGHRVAHRVLGLVPNPIAQYMVAGLWVVVGFAVAWGTKLDERMHTYDIWPADGCRIKDKSGEGATRSLGDGRAEAEIIEGGHHVLYCPSGEVETTAYSLLSPGPELRTLEDPDDDDDHEKEHEDSKTSSPGEDGEAPKARELPEPIFEVSALADTDTPMRLIALEGDRFWMGSPETEPGRGVDELRHRVDLPAFAICETEVSAQQYERVMGAKPASCALGCADDQPVQGVSWYDALRFMNALTARENLHGRKQALTPCYDQTTWKWDFDCTGYRLPTEAEWEYAARGGTTSAWSFGDDTRDICEYGNIADSACAGAFDKLAPVKTDGLLPNPWGLHGVHGNVAEWVFDRYRGYVQPNDNARYVNTDSTNRVLRGGSFDFPVEDARSANRGWSKVGRGDRDIGFRCARGPRAEP